MLTALASRRQTTHLRSPRMRLIPIVVVLASLVACGPRLSVVVPPAEDVCATLHGDPGITARLYFGRANTSDAASFFCASEP